MDDRFKFRVWDKEQNKYLPLVSRDNDLDFWISLDNTGIYLVERDNNRDVAYFNDITQDVVIQQCTGLKDKNGTLIYEGDIVKGKKETTCSPHSSKMVDKIGVIEIPNEMFVASCREVKNNCTLFCQCDWHKTEVIGNMYENKELIESEER